MHRLTIAAALALAACAPAAPPIIAYDVPYSAKFGSVRPEPRPAATTFRAPRWPGCDPLPEDCGSGELPTVTPTVQATPPGWTRPDVPPFDFTPELPGRPTPQPEAAPPATEPEPEPETPEPGPAGQNPGNNKPVGNAPFDGERGERPSGREKDKGRGPA
jgi:hypothetical protein